jgi:hypothetical protein
MEFIPSLNIPSPDIPSRRIALLLCLVVVFFTGCGKPRTTAKPKEAEKEAVPIEQLKGAVTGTKWHLPWSVRNPKDPNGKPVRVMLADAELGAMKNDDGNMRVHLQQVKARLFRDGKPAAYVEARQISANRKERIIVGTGNVIVHSLSDPPDTVIKADKMRWDTRTSIIVAIGNAFLTRRLPDGKLATSRSDQVTFDTKLKDFIIE